MVGWRTTVIRVLLSGFDGAYETYNRGNSLGI